MIRDRYEPINRCLHVTNAPVCEQDHDSPTYDKLHKLWWMIDEVKERFKAMWSPNQQLTVDESMVMYKGKYCPMRQYMPKKPVRFGIKVWAAADAISKYLWNFEVYCGKQGNPCDDDMPSDEDFESGMLMDNLGGSSSKGEGFQGRNVVKDLLKDLGGRAILLPQIIFLLLYLCF
jgi:hypothetical protein